MLEISGSPPIVECMKYRDLVNKLRVAGFEFDRHGKGSHELWRHAQTGRRVTITHHSGDVKRGLLRAIIREIGLTPEEFDAL